MSFWAGTDDPGNIYVAPGGFRAFRKIRVEVKDEFPCEVHLRGEIREGTYVVTEVRCIQPPNGQEVTGEVIRAVPVAMILRKGALEANKLLMPGRKPEDVRAAGPTHDSLQTVARVYRMAHLLRDTPTKAVAAALDLPYPTAARWVGQARKAGLLGPAETGRAGERMDNGRDA